MWIQYPALEAAKHNGLEVGSEAREPEFKIQAPPHDSCVTLSKLLNFFPLPFIHLKMGVN